jgi:TetR/AcrR family transcriptional regulator
MVKSRDASREQYFWPSQFDGRGACEASALKQILSAEPIFCAGGQMDKPLVKGPIRAANERVILEAAEAVFAETGYKGATTAQIAKLAGVPKANLHYYFATKEDLYRAVVERVLNAWLAAAASFDESDDPMDALSRYIGAKMDLARAMPLGSRIWATEIMRGAPVIQDFLETTLADWVETRTRTIQRWIKAGKLRPIEPKVLLYMIWSTTQHYANAAHEIATLDGGRGPGEAAFARMRGEVIEIITRGLEPG